MFTVILLDKYSSDLQVDYRFLFQPFENTGEIAICAWNESGSNFESMLPDIRHTIQGKREWRAIVVNTDSLYGYKGRPIPADDNPFDYSKLDRDKMPHKSNIPLIRLSHILGGYPAPVREFEAGLEYYDDDNIPRQVRCSLLSEEESAYITEQYAPVKKIFMEKEIPEGVIKRTQAMEKKFAFDGVRPSELWLVAAKIRKDSRERSLAMDAWKNPTEITSSAFCERNRYPDQCRFLFSEISSTQVADYGRNLVEFWLSILTLSLNKVPAAAIQAYRLYRMNVDISNAILQQTLNTHLDRLEAVDVTIAEELTKDTVSKSRGNEQIYEKVDIAVVPREDDEKDIVQTDEDEDEDTPVWKSLMNERLNSFNDSARDTRRAIDRAARSLRAKAEYYRKLDTPVVTDEFHLDDLKADIAARELEILSTRPRNKYDRKKVESILNDARSQQNESLADEEMSSQGSGAAVAIGLALIGFIPWLQGAWGMGGWVFFKSLLVTALVVGIMYLGGYLAMGQFRRAMKKRVFEITSRFKEVKKDMDDTVNSYSAYFSDIGTFLSAQSTLRRIDLSDEIRIYRDKLSTHRRALRATVDSDKRWMSDFELDRQETPILHTESFFNSDVSPHENSLYYYPVCGVDSEIPLNASGDYIRPPYAFVCGMKIQREAIFDEVESRS